MECKDIKILIIEDICGEINNKNKHTLENHLKNCSKCSGEYNELKNTSNSLKSWPEESLENISLPENLITSQKRKSIFYKIAVIAASILLIFSLANFQFSFDQNGLNIKFNLLGYSNSSADIAADILNNGSNIEQLRLMTELINASNNQQKQEMVSLLTDFYQAIEMRRQADLKIISRGMETLRNTSNQRIEDTEETMQKLVQYTGSILDKGNFIKSVETP